MNKYSEKYSLYQITSLINPNIEKRIDGFIKRFRVPSILIFAP